MASSGVRVSAQRPPAMPKMTRTRTRNAFRALDSMTRSSRDGLGRSVGEAPPHSLAETPRRRDADSALPYSGSPIAFSGGSSDMVISPWLIPSPGLQRALHFGLGVDEEVGAGHHALVFVQPGHYLVELAVLAAEFDEARLESAFAFVHENDVAFSGGGHRGQRH